MIDALTVRPFRPAVAGLAMMLSSGAGAQLDWPVADALHQRTYISNYTDFEPAAGFTDYECGNDHGYDGHLGIDVAARDFRVADQGVPILAVADGTVDFVRFNTFDRNLWPPYDGPGNGVWLAHDDGRYTLYWHMRANSVAVSVGERVSRGQFLGFIASSGSSPIPHLHFQLNHSRELNDRIVPLVGDCNLGPSEFADQPPYVGNAPIRVLALGVHTESQLTGLFQNGSLPLIKQGLVEPTALGREQSAIPVFVQVQGNRGDRLTLSLFTPDGALWDRFETVLLSKRRYGWLLHNFPLNPSAPAGRWTLEVSAGEVVLRSARFSIEDQPKIPPRFFPNAGLSIRLDGREQVWELNQTDKRAPASLVLVGAPEGVTLAQAQLILDADLALAYRQSQFAVRAEDPDGQSDLFHVHVVDPRAQVDPARISDFSPSGGALFGGQSPGTDLLWISTPNEDGLSRVLWLPSAAPDGQRPTGWVTGSAEPVGKYLTAATQRYPTVANGLSEVEPGTLELFLESCRQLNLTFDFGPGTRDLRVLRRLDSDHCSAP